MLFELRAEIRRKLQEGIDPAPSKVSDAIAGEVPEEYLRLALSQALPYLVRDEIRKVRHAAFGRQPAHDGTRNRPSPGASLVSAAKAGETETPPSEGARARGGTEAFSLWQVPVSLEPGLWRYLGDCSETDIKTAAAFLDKRASENKVRADGFHELAKHMRSEGAARVRDLDPEKVHHLVRPDGDRAIASA